MKPQNLNIVNYLTTGNYGVMKLTIHGIRTKQLLFYYIFGKRCIPNVGENNRKSGLNEIREV